MSTEVDIGTSCFECIAKSILKTVKQQATPRPGPPYRTSNWSSHWQKLVLLAYAECKISSDSSRNRAKCIFPIIAGLPY